MKLLLLCLFAVLISACSTVPPVSPEQLAAVTRDNNASVGCATGTGPWGRANVVYVNAQNANVISGKVNVNTDCSVTIEATSPGTATTSTTATVSPPK